MKRLLIIIFILIITLIQSQTFAQAARWKWHELPQGIAVEIPQDWEITPKEELKYLDDIGEKRFRTIFSAKDYGPIDFPVASFRIAVGPPLGTISQESIAKMSYDDLSKMIEEASSQKQAANPYSEIQNNSDSYEIDKLLISGLLALDTMHVFTRSQDKLENLESLIVIPLKNRAIYLISTYPIALRDIYSSKIAHIVNSTRIE